VLDLYRLNTRKLPDHEPALGLRSALQNQAFSFRSEIV